MTSYLARSAARRAILRNTGEVTPGRFAIGSVVTIAALILLLVIVWLASIAVDVGAGQ